MEAHEKGFFTEGNSVEVVTGRNRNAKSERLKTVMEVITRKLHEAVKEIEPTQEEWFAAIMFLTETGQMCNEWRQEYILLSDILYIQALGDYVTIVTFDKKITVHLTLRNIETELPAAKFYRLHRSFIAALDHIDVIEDNTAFIHGHPVPIGEPYKQTLLKKLHLV